MGSAHTVSRLEYGINIILVTIFPKKCRLIESLEDDGELQTMMPKKTETEIIRSKKRDKF